MQTIKPDQLVTQLKWRYATKQFDPSRKISAQDWAALEESLILSPSSFGLQPWKFILVQDPKVRESLLPASWGQKQVVDCSHYVVLAIQKKFGEAGIDSFLKRTIEVRGGSLDKLNGYRDMMIGALVKGPTGARIDDWSARQVYIALGNLMTSAAMLDIDACPMEGFEPAKYDEILGLGKLGLASTVACALGYRAGTDKYASLPKVRYQANELFIRI